MIKLSRKNKIESYSEEELSFIEKNYEMMSGTKVHNFLVWLMQKRNFEKNNSPENYFVIYTNLDDDNYLDNWIVYKSVYHVESAVSDFGSCITMLADRFTKKQLAEYLKLEREQELKIQEKTLAEIRRYLMD